MSSMSTCNSKINQDSSMCSAVISAQLLDWQQESTLSNLTGPISCSKATDQLLNFFTRTVQVKAKAFLLSNSTSSLILFQTSNPRLPATAGRPRPFGRHSTKTTDKTGTWSVQRVIQTECTSPPLATSTQQCLSTASTTFMLAIRLHDLDNSRH